MKKVLDIVDSIEKLILAIPFLLLGICIVIEVFTRKFMGFGLSWLQEMGRYTMVYGTFLGASIAVKQGNHPSMTALTDFLPKKPKIVIAVLGNLICAACLAFVGYFSWIQFSNYIKIGTKTSSLWGMPIYVPFMILPICITVMSIRFLIQCYTGPKQIIENAQRKEEIK